MEKETLVVNYVESEIPAAFSRRITMRDESITLSEDLCKVEARLTVAALAKAASERKLKESPVATIIDDLEGKTLLACIVQFVPEDSGKKSDDDDTESLGSWRCDFTFYDEDIPENARRVKLSDRKMDAVFRSVAATYAITYNSDAFIYLLSEVFVTTLIEFLDNSAVADKIVEVELTDYFTARVELDEEGKKVMSFIPGGSIVRKAIKSDIDLVE